MGKDVFEYLDSEGNHSPKTYIVLGCHRGGTSFVGQALKDAGVDIQGGPGRREDIRFVHLNRDIIYEAGSTWQRPPAREKILSAVKAFENKARALLREASSGKKAWAWKDPQQALTAEGLVPLWKEELDDVYLICVFRKPENTDTSLRRIRQHGNGASFAKEYARRTIKAIERFMELDVE